MLLALRQPVIITSQVTDVKGTGNMPDWQCQLALNAMDGMSSIGTAIECMLLVYEQAVFTLSSPFGGQHRAPFVVPVIDLSLA